MKNIHLIKTDKPSRLCFRNYLFINKDNITEYSNVKFKNIYITSDEEIKKGEYGLSKLNEIVKFHSSYDYRYYTKIILTTDQDLIKDGVQAIDDEFLEWFVNNQSCEEVKVQKVEHMTNMPYRIILPKEKLSKDEIDKFFVDMVCNSKEEPKQKTFNSKRGLKEVQLKDPNTCEHYKEVGCIKDVCNCYTLISKQETIEEAALKLYPRIINDPYNPLEDDNKEERDIWIEGAKYQAKKMYNESEVKNILDEYLHYLTINSDLNADEWFKKFKK